MEKNNRVSAEVSVVDLLSERGWHISFAESCTGGLAAARLVDVPSASRVFDVSFVTYANEAKMEHLSVSGESIDKYGVVSRQVVEEMARGVAMRANAEVGVGISGIAGPSGGSKEKPVGTVCFGFYINGEVYSYTEHFGDIGRRGVRIESVDFVYERLLELLRN